MRLDQIRRLIELVSEADIAELEVREKFNSIRITKTAAGSAVMQQVPMQMMAPAAALAAPAAASAAGAPAAAAPAEDTSHLVPITAPMVGTFYRSPAPDAEAYVEEGRMVEPGQTVCIIEAMKLMNEIESEVRGRVAKILVANASPVEFGQPLFLIDTTA